MIRLCAVCSNPFECPPSDKTVTCSKKCSRIHKSRTHKGKHNKWNKTARKLLSNKGVTDNLKKGSIAAQNSPNSGRFATNVNAKEWVLVSPSGKIYKVRNLKNWARNNCHLFDKETSEESATQIASGIRAIKQVLNGNRKDTSPQYMGWTLKM